MPMYLSPKIMFYMISHNNIIQFYKHFGMSKRPVFHHTLVGPLVQSSMCLAANSETPFWWKFVLKIVSMVILSPPLSQFDQRNSGHSILIKYGTV